MPFLGQLNKQTLTVNEAALEAKVFDFSVPSGMVSAAFTAPASVTGLVIRQNDFSGLFIRKATALGNTTEVFVPYSSGTSALGLGDADRISAADTPQLVASGVPATLNGVNGVLYFFNTGVGNTAATANQRSLNFAGKIIATI